jgi:hypothetical protein
VEKIRLIHTLGHVYYHYHPFFLSKLTKEGKPSRLRQGRSHRTTDGYAGMTRALFCLQKKANQAVVATTTLALTQLLLLATDPVRVSTHEQTLLDIRLVYRKNETHPFPP